jgi:hypothetical protein
MSVEVDPEAVRDEKKIWTELAGKMLDIQRAVARLDLGVTAFFIGNFTELLYHPAYSKYWDMTNDRLWQAEGEFELIGKVLERIAESYEETDELSADEVGKLYTVTEEDTAEAHRN